MDTATARQALAESGAQGVMVGRGVQGRPWLLAQIAQDIYGTAAPKVPQGAAFVDMVMGHYDTLLAFYGTKLGLRVARKHLGWYMDHAGTTAPMRRRVLTAKTVEETMIALPHALETSDRDVAA